MGNSGSSIKRQQPSNEYISMNKPTKQNTNRTKMKNFDTFDQAKNEVGQIINSIRLIEGNQSKNITEKVRNLIQIRQQVQQMQPTKNNTNNKKKEVLNIIQKYFTLPSSRKNALNLKNEKQIRDAAANLFLKNKETGQIRMDEKEQIRVIQKILLPIANHYALLNKQVEVVRFKFKLFNSFGKKYKTLRNVLNETGRHAKNVAEKKKIKTRRSFTKQTMNELKKTKKMLKNIFGRINVNKKVFFSVATKTIENKNARKAVNLYKVIDRWLSLYLEGKELNKSDLQVLREESGKLRSKLLKTCCGTKGCPVCPQNIINQNSSNNTNSSPTTLTQNQKENIQKKRENIEKKKENIKKKLNHNGVISKRNSAALSMKNHINEILKMNKLQTNKIKRQHFMKEINKINSGNNLLNDIFSEYTSKDIHHLLKQLTRNERNNLQKKVSNYRKHMRNYKILDNEWKNLHRQQQNIKTPIG